MQSFSADAIGSSLGVLICRLMPAAHRLVVIPATCSVDGSVLDLVLE